MKNQKFFILNKNESVSSDDEQDNKNKNRDQEDSSADKEAVKPTKNKQNENLSNEYLLDTFTDYPLQSRLNTEFEVIGIVGRGAFGEGTL